MSTITLVGDRQSGKTHTLLTIGATDAIAGKTVLYRTAHVRMVTEAFHRYQQMVDDSTVERVYRANGAQRVLHTSGGAILFGRTFDLAQIDTLLLDEIYGGYELCGVQGGPHHVSYPDMRVFRTSL